ncbi:hypothetical protein [Pseudonocardia sp. C8]|uniref:hypothetical protein n=1 Tax=Pseudonocardia sp. C8 TaxID=2762759 RepID=UPI00351C99FA
MTIPELGVRNSFITAGDRVYFELIETVDGGPLHVLGETLGHGQQMLAMECDDLTTTITAMRAAGWDVADLQPTATLGSRAAGSAARFAATARSSSARPAPSGTWSPPPRSSRSPSSPARGDESARTARPGASASVSAARSPSTRRRPDPFRALGHSSSGRTETLACISVRRPDVPTTPN